MVMKSGERFPPVFRYLDFLRSPEPAFVHPDSPED